MMFTIKTICVPKPEIAHRHRVSLGLKKIDWRRIDEEQIWPCDPCPSNRQSPFPVAFQLVDRKLPLEVGAEFDFPPEWQGAEYVVTQVPQGSDDNALIVKSFTVLTNCKAPFHLSGDWVWSISLRTGKCKCSQIRLALY